MVIRRHVDAIILIIRYEIACLLIDVQVIWLCLLIKEELGHILALILGLLHWDLVRLYSSSTIDPDHLRSRRDQISLQVNLLLIELFIDWACFWVKYAILRH